MKTNNKTGNITDTTSIVIKTVEVATFIRKVEVPTTLVNSPKKLKRWIEEGNYIEEEVLDVLDSKTTSAEFIKVYSKADEMRTWE